MAQWKETLEPYVKVYETIRGSVLNPSAGGDLIIGCAFVSDAGPSVPTLITSQSEFLATYASKDLTEAYVKGLDELYNGASTMWLNAYRLSGSNSLLCVRASKAEDTFFVKPLIKESSESNYVIRDGELMKQAKSFVLALDHSGDDVTPNASGWSINIDGVGRFGNYVDKEKGAQYDYYVSNLVDLVDKLNETSKFFSPKYSFYEITQFEANVDESGSVSGLTTLKGTLLDNISSDSSDADKAKVGYVKFEEVYLGKNLIDTTTAGSGLVYCLFGEGDGSKIITATDMNNNVELSGFEADKYYATNVFNSASELKVRIRRFNHDAVSQKSISSSSLTENGESPWVVLKNILKTWGDKPLVDSDFYEVAVMDPSISSEPLYFNIGKYSALGDMEVAEVNDSLKMIQLVLPDDMSELGLSYFGYGDGAGKDEDSQIWAELTIDPTKTEILNVSESDLKKALDKIALDEVYVTEGLTDLGNTNLGFQNYMANMAINENYFYPISTVNSTNYMTIANNASKISQDSSKLYMSAPWDIDSGTFGWKTYISPSVIYWEAVARNRRNNEEFRGILGQSGGIVQYQKPLVEFNKKTRQLLLSRRINTVLWNTQTSAWNMNDNFTKQSVENIMSDDGNSRLAIRISKAMPVILRQFIGRKINAKLWSDAKGVIDYWFRSTITPMQYTIAEYVVIIDERNNPVELQKQNKMAVTVNVRYLNSLKYITVYHNILEVGMDISAI